MSKKLTFILLSNVRAKKIYSQWKLDSAVYNTGLASFTSMAYKLMAVDERSIITAEM